MADADYSNREIDAKFNTIVEALGRIETQTTKTNGRVTRIETVLLVAAAVVATWLAVARPDLLFLVKPFV